MVTPSHHLSRMKERLVVFTGAGISAESGLATFRDADGLWEGQRPEDLASVQAWQTKPQRVLRFYNAGRDQLRPVAPNAAPQWDTMKFHHSWSTPSFQPKTTVSSNTPALTGKA